MRIIVTEQGGTLLKALSNDKYHDDLKKANSPKKRHNEKESSLDKNKLKDNLENLRVLEIKNKKLSIPKDIAEKYNEIKDEETSILPKLYTNLKKSAQQKEQQSTRKNTVEDINTESTRENTEGGAVPTSKKNPNSLSYYSMENQPFMQTSYRVKDIMTDEALANMKNNIIKEVNLKNRLANVVSINFRNPFLTPQSRIKDIEGALSTKIQTDKSNIIQYINSKNCLSPKLVKKIANYDEEKFERLNKICQRVFNNNIEEKDMKYRINGIIENIHQTNKADYKKQMNEMEKEVQGIKHICDKYPPRDDREKYENLLYDMKKNHWNKYDFQRLMKRGNKNLKTEN